MFLYIYDQKTQDWIEAESLFPHDVALLIDNTNRLVYFHTGSKTLPEVREKGMQSSKEILQKFATYKLEILEDIIPLKIQSEIDMLLGDNIDSSRYKEERTMLMNIFMIFGILGIFISSVVLINNLLMFGWDHTISQYSVNQTEFESLFNLSIIFAWIAVGIYGALIINSFISQRIFLIVTSIVSCGIAIGLALYLSKKENIFSFTHADVFEIIRMELIFHGIWIILAWAALSIPILISIGFILKETEIKQKVSISIDEIKKSAKPTVLKDKSPVKMKEIEKKSRKT